MNAFLIDSARTLSDDEAGGHGNRWAVFGDASSLLKEWLPVWVQEGALVELGLDVPLDRDRRGLPVALGMLHADDQSLAGRAGALSIVEKVEPTATGEGQLKLVSAVPLFAEGAMVESEVFEIALFPNRLEARIAIETPQGASLEPFDTLFWKHGPHYREGVVYKFRICGFAYSLIRAKPATQIIDKPEQIRAFRARDAWVKEHGHWEKKNDEEAALAAWQPNSPEDLEPIKIEMGGACMIFPAMKGPTDDHMFQGEVVDVHPRAVTLYGMQFWRVDVTMIRSDTGFAIPVYVAESCFEDDWRPAKGEFVAGTMWLQAYALSIVDSISKTIFKLA